MSAREDLLKLILEVSFEKRKVTLTSGKQSDFYLDLRQTLMRPRGAVYQSRRFGPIEGEGEC